MNTPLAIVNLKATSRPVATIKYFSNPKKVTAVYDGLDAGVAKGTPRQLAELLLAFHHDSRASRVCRTAVISVKTPRRASEAELKEIDRRLLRASADLQKFLGVASMLGWVHGNTSMRHIHLIFANSNGRRTLDLRPKFLKELQAMQWTVQFVTGRGKGRRRSLPMYPKSKKLDVRLLALMLMDSRGKVRKEIWDKLVRSGKISNFRHRKNGEVISFEFQGRRIRLATLKNFLTALGDEDNQSGEEPMTHIIDPHEPLPNDMRESLHESGFSSEDVQEVLADIRAALAMSGQTPVVPAKSKPHSIDIS
jgi:hypothetical protein